MTAPTAAETRTAARAFGCDRAATRSAQPAQTTSLHPWREVAVAAAVVVVAVVMEWRGSFTATKGCCCENDRLFLSVTPGERGGGGGVVVAYPKNLSAIRKALRVRS